MQWTTDKPMKSGYYWWRKNKWKSESMYYVYQNDNNEMYARWCHSGLYDREKLKDIDGEWYGPLTPPE